MSVVPAFCAARRGVGSGTDWVLIVPKHARKAPCPTTGGRPPAKVESCLHVPLTAEPGFPAPRVRSASVRQGRSHLPIPRNQRGGIVAMYVTEFPTLR